jgi:hypothetical protein
MGPEGSCSHEAANGPYPEPDESRPDFPKLLFNITLPSKPRSSEWSLPLQAFQPKFLTHFSSPPCAVHAPRPCVTFRNMLVFLRWGVVSPPPNPQAGEPPLVGCPRLFIQYIRNDRPHLEAFSSIRKLRTCHTVVTSDPLNVVVVIIIIAVCLFAYRPALGSTQFPIQWVPGSLSKRAKRPQREINLLSPLSVEV